MRRRRSGIPTPRAAFAVRSDGAGTPPGEAASADDDTEYGLAAAVFGGDIARAMLPGGSTDLPGFDGSRRRPDRSGIPSGFPGAGAAVLRRRQ